MGRWQIEAGFTYSRAVGTSTDTSPDLAIRYPLNPKLELRLNNLTIGSTPGASGLLDPSAGIKYLLEAAGEHRAEVAVIVQTSLPAGTGGFRVNRSQAFVQLPFSLALDSATGVGGMLSIADVGPSTARFTQYGAGAYLSRLLDAKTTVIAEVYGIAPVSYGGPNGSFADLVFTFLSNERTQFDARIGSGLDQGRDGWHCGAGVSYRF